MDGHSLLSSLQGAAVTAVQIDSVLHEFSSIAGVREDVTDIILNIKKLAVSIDGEIDGPRRLSLKATGPGEVTAAQIEEVSGITVHNAGLAICNLDDGANAIVSSGVTVPSVSISNVSLS